MNEHTKRPAKCVQISFTVIKIHDQTEIWNGKID